MRKSLAILGGAVLLSGLSACGGGGLFDRNRPDEFAVSRQAPLVIPPDYSLEPPQPGAAPVQAGTDQEQVLDALFGGPAPRSPVEQAVSREAGDDDLGIRSEVGDPATNVVSKGSVTRDIIAAPEGDGQEAQAGTIVPNNSATPTGEPSATGDPLSDGSQPSVPDGYEPVPNPN